jgi:tetratricopeptide (TPR) repeat protein
LLCWLLWERQRQQIFGILWMVAILAPALNSRWMPGNVFAERYLFVPSIGFCWVIAYGALAVWDAGAVRRHAWVRATALTSGIVLCVLLAVRTEVRNSVWHTDLTLFLDSVEKNPNSSDLHSDLGFAYWALHNHPAAIEQWNISLALNPNSFWALNNLGMAALNDKRYSDAIPLLRRSVALSSQFTDAHLNLAETYSELNQTDDAEKEYLAAIDSSPLDWDVHNRYAAFLQQAGRVEDAQKQYLISQDVEPNAQALDGLGDIALDRGQKELAERYFRQAADLDSYDHHAHYQLVFLYGDSGRIDEAIREYKLGQLTDVGTDKLSQDAKALIDRLQKK